MVRFVASLYPEDPILKCLRHKDNPGAAYVELRSKEELKNLLVLNGVLRPSGGTKLFWKQLATEQATAAWKGKEAAKVETRHLSGQLADASAKLDKAQKANSNEKETQPIRLCEQLANANAKIVKAQKAAENEREAETNRLVKKLAKTEQQLNAVHESWQEQQQQLLDHQEHFTDLKARLADFERRFQHVTQSLVVQTTELANERQAKRELEADLAEQHQMYKKAKRKLAAKYVKPEVNFDV
jgi:chromosome segregation ATPase